jgi:phosphatidylinositol alpha-1,6-mannosyltransferase
MERLNWNLLRELAVDFEVRTCCPQECLAQLPPQIVGKGVPLRPLARFLLGSALASRRLATRFEPSLVVAGSGLMVPAAQWAAAANGAKVLAYLHGLDIVAASPIYQRFWVRRFRTLDAVLVNSGSTRALAIAAGIPAERISILHPGTELPRWNPAAATEFRDRFNLGVRPILLSLGRLTARKGLAEFIENSMPALVSARPELVLVVIGGEPLQSVKRDRGNQTQRIRQVVQALKLEENVLLLGEQDDAAVHAAMFASRALVFPVLDLPGDSEGFGMVALEAAAHGVPTAAFAVGGVVDAIADPDTGWLCKPGDYAALGRVLQERLQGFQDEAAAVSVRRDFAKRFEWPSFGERLRSLCADAIDRRHD